MNEAPVQVRQGNVLLEKVASVPPGSTVVPPGNRGDVLALGDFPVIDRSLPNMPIAGGDVAVLLTNNKAGKEFIRLLASVQSILAGRGQVDGIGGQLEETSQCRSHSSPGESRP